MGKFETSLEYGDLKEEIYLTQLYIYVEKDK